MPAREKLIDYKYVAGLVIAGALAYWSQREADASRIATIESKGNLNPEIWNRDIDSLKSRVQSIEEYLRDRCNK